MFGRKYWYTPLRYRRHGQKGKTMLFYCVVIEFYDNGRVAAWITNHAGAKDENDIPKNRMEEHKGKDVYFYYFTDKKEAIKFCDEAKSA